MGCGHSKINIYSKKRNKNCNKKTVTPEKTENLEARECVDNIETDANDKVEDCDRKTIKVKPFSGPLLTQTEISSSQNNFFKMLDDKIQSGPDYDSSSELERALEAERLSSLLKDWETASAGSRSLPTTPRKRPQPQHQHRGGEKAARREDAVVGVRSAEIPRQAATERIYNPHSQSIIHQSYGVTQIPYRQTTNYVPVYQSSPTHQTQYASTIQQYQAMYTSQQPVRQYNIYTNPAAVVPAKPYDNNSSSSSPKHIPFEPPAYNVPATHKQYGGSAPKTRFTNGDLIQQQIYQQQVQYQQAREYQQYKQTREQQLLQQQVLQQQGYGSSRNYQSTVHIPIVMPTSQSDTHREQYELT